MEARGTQTMLTKPIFQADTQEFLFHAHEENNAQNNGTDEPAELFNVWASQLVRIKEVADSRYTQEHPLQSSLGLRVSWHH
jgi:hypothetical protein